MRKQIKLTFAKNVETGNIEIINQYSDFDYPLNIDLGVTNTGMIVINGFQDFVENGLFAVCSSFQNLDLSINHIDGEVYAIHRVNGVLTNDIPTFSVLIEQIF